MYLILSKIFFFLVLLTTEPNRYILKEGLKYTYHIRFLFSLEHIHLKEWIFHRADLTIIFNRLAFSKILLDGFSAFFDSKLNKEKVF